MSYFIICLTGVSLCCLLVCLTLLVELVDKVKDIKRKVDQWMDKH